MTVRRMLMRCALAATLIVAAGPVVHAAAPTVGSVSPNNGPQSGGTIVLIAGTNFIGTTKVTFGGVETTDFIVISDFRLSVGTPPHEPGLVSVDVTNADGTGTGNNLFTYIATATAVNDSYETPAGMPLVVAAPGVLGNDETNGGGAMSASIWTGPSNGGVSLSSDGSFTYTPIGGFAGVDSFTYRVSNTVGLGGVGTVTITVTAPRTASSPTGLQVWTLAGNTVTLRWNAPLLGLTPTRYVVECGFNPGEVLISLATADATTVLTFNAPNGAFFCRVHTLSGAERSPASNEIRIFVNTTAVPPSAPEDLSAFINGTSVGLSWRNTFAGGTPASLVLDVTGSLSTSIALGLGESVSFAGVPAGVYTVSLRAVNAGGSSGPSNPVTLTFPGACSGAPPAPPNFLAYKVGATIVIIWGPSPAGSPAATSYLLNVSGSFVGAVPSTSRMLSGTVGAGVYNFSVVAINGCGSSPSTAVQTVAIP